MNSVSGFVCLHAVDITVSLLLSVKSCVYCLCFCVDSNGLCQRKNFSTFLTLMVWLLTAQEVPALDNKKTGEIQRNYMEKQVYRKVHTWSFLKDLMEINIKL